jgi:simple sugar transport system substrate-binding protein
MTIHRILRALVSLLFIMGFTSVYGAGAPEAAKAAPQERFKIYVVVHGGIADPAWELNHRGAQAVADQLPDLELHYVGPPAYNLEEFISDLEASIAAKPDALVVTLTAPAMMDEILRPAIKAGLPVIAINAPDSRPPTERIPVLTYVGLSSMYDVGVVAAQTILKQMKPKRAVFCNHHPGAAHIEDSGRGFVDTMKAAGVPAGQLLVGEDPVEAAEITIAYLKANPDTQAILHPNATHLEVLVKRMEEEGIIPGKDVLLVNAFDPTEGIMDQMLQGKVLASNDQQMYLQGFYGVLFGYMKAKYGFQPPLPPVGTGPIVISKKDVPSLRELIAKGYR